VDVYYARVAVATHHTWLAWHAGEAAAREYRGPGLGATARRAATEIRACVDRQLTAILSAMNTDSYRIPAKPTLDGLEDKWAQRWAKERVVQV